MIVLYIAAAIIVLLLFLIFPALRRHPDRKLIENSFIAHRGLHDKDRGIPENSAAAFSAAVKEGYPIETDIRLTADGSIVAVHDDNLMRLASVDRNVSDMTLDEVKEIRLCGTDERIPTLCELLELVDGKVPLLIEFKCGPRDYRSLCEGADKILKKYNGKYLIQSFFPLVPGWYRKNNPCVCRGLLSMNFMKNKKKSLNGIASTLFLCNVVARPDFISFNHWDSEVPGRRLCTLLGALPVGWTFRSRQEVEKRKNDYCTFIFEDFDPRRKD